MLLGRPAVTMHYNIATGSDDGSLTACIMGASKKNSKLYCIKRSVQTISPGVKLVQVEGIPRA